MHLSASLITSSKKTVIEGIQPNDMPVAELILILVKGFTKYKELELANITDSYAIMYIVRSFVTKDSS